MLVKMKLPLGMMAWSCNSSLQKAEPRRRWDQRNHFLTKGKRKENGQVLRHDDVWKISVAIRLYSVEESKLKHDLLQTLSPILWIWAHRVRNTWLDDSIHFSWLMVALCQFIYRGILIFHQTFSQVHPVCRIDGSKSMSSPFSTSSCIHSLLVTFK